MDEVHRRHREPSALTVAALVDTVGTVVIRPVPHAIGLGNIVSAPVIFDPMDELPDSPGGVLLMVGLAPKSTQVSTTMPAAAERGYSAVVVKARGQPLHDVADAAETAGIALLVVDEAVPWRHLDALIMAVTSNHSRSDPSDTGSGDLFVLANAIATALEGAVAIEDLDRNVLAYSNLEQHKVDRTRRIGILGRRVPDMDKNIRQYREVLLAEGVVHFPYDRTDGELPRCAAAVRAGRQPVGSIWVIEADQHVGPDGETALKDACRLAAIHILQAQSAVDIERQLRAEWLRSLLEGHGSLLTTAARFGMTAGVPSVVVAFGFPAGLGSSPLLPQLTTAVEQYCGVFRTNVSCVAIGRTVYVLFPSVRDEEMPRRVATGASIAVEARLGHPAHAAISSAGLGHSALHQLRLEVDQVLAVIGSADSTPSVATATDIHAQILLTTLAREFARNETPLHSGVRALLDHDQARGTQYQSTLCTYFGALGDVAETARQLNIHPNTLRYRLRRAADAFRVPLDHPDDILTTWLQLRLAPKG
ncbi:MAG: PucR family transcriptional regulator [Mycobacterium sp.]